MDYGRTELADRLAAEYAAGLLRGPARRRLEALLPAHPSLRRAVREWQDRLMPLTAQVEPQAPTASLWPRIEQQLFGTPAPAPTWWRGLAFWRGFSTVAGVAAIALALVLATPKPAQPPVIVVLSAADVPGGGAAPPPFVASINADGRAMVTRPLTPVSMQPDRSLELWSLPVSGAPRSLGVISANGATVVDRGRLLQDTDKLAVTMEVQGGSPDGRPHGPILYVGKLSI